MNEEYLEQITNKIFELTKDSKIYWHNNSYAGFGIHNLLGYTSNWSNLDLNLENRNGEVTLFFKNQREQAYGVSFFPEAQVSIKYSSPTTKLLYDLIHLKINVAQAERENKGMQKLISALNKVLE